MLLALLACPGPDGWTADPDSNLCGRVDPTGTSGGQVWIAAVAEGETACVGGDTGGPGWWGDVVAEPELVDDRFEATLDPGEYGVEVAADGMAGCAGVEIVGEDTCAHTVVVEIREQMTADKPNVYLSPERPTEVAVALPAWRRITESDPRYPVNGWRVTAFPDGRLRTAAGSRDFLFYEMRVDPDRFQTDAGWCVPGALAQATIEDAMVDLGFLPNEVADFAEAWDESFPTAPTLTVYPQVDGLPGLVVDPPPDHLLRAWFLVAEGCDDVAPPVLAAVPRVGWHAAEWGVAFRAPLSAGEILVQGWR
jgi:hypothetical protein